MVSFHMAWPPLTLYISLFLHWLREVKGEGGGWGVFALSLAELRGLWPFSSKLLKRHPIFLLPVCSKRPRRNARCMVSMIHHQQEDISTAVL